MKKSLKVAVIIVLLLNLLVLSSCGSGRRWSCQKRYVNTEKKEVLNVKNS